AFADGGWGQKCIEKSTEDPNCSGNGASEQGKQRRPRHAKKQNVEYDIKQELHCFLVGFANKKGRGGPWLFTGLPAVEQDEGRHACRFCNAHLHRCTGAVFPAFGGTLRTRVRRPAPRRWHEMMVRLP